MPNCKELTRIKYPLVKKEEKKDEAIREIKKVYPKPENFKRQLIMNTQIMQNLIVLVSSWLIGKVCSGFKKYETC
jgi:hypothetical protein